MLRYRANNNNSHDDVDWGELFLEHGRMASCLCTER